MWFPSCVQATRGVGKWQTDVVLPAVGFRGASTRVFPQRGEVEVEKSGAGDAGLLEKAAHAMSQEKVAQLGRGGLWLQATSVYEFAVSCRSPRFGCTLWFARRCGSHCSPLSPRRAQDRSCRGLAERRATSMVVSYFSRTQKPVAMEGSGVTSPIAEPEVDKADSEKFEFNQVDEDAHGAADEKVKRWFSGTA